MQHPSSRSSAMTSSSVPNCQVHAFHQASDLPKEAWDALLKHEAPANVILWFAQKEVHNPCDGDSKPLWIVAYDDTGNVECVLSCTKGKLDHYPIFIVDCKSSAQRAQDEKRGKTIADTLQPLVHRLLEEVPPQRVFSAFSTAEVVEKFAEAFVAQVPPQHGIQSHKKPYYDATFTFCTRATLKKPSEAISPFPEDIDISLRRGNLGDLKAIALLDQEFSKTSEPYVLTDKGAELEAKSMIENNQVWIHIVRKDGQEEEIACVVATTRESDNVTAVTKVFTAEKWRGRGCAGRLLHRVCDEILEKKKLVVLYVGNTKELAPARKVYHRVGFQGLVPGHPVKGVERWLEIGFTNTNLGYW